MTGNAKQAHVNLPGAGERIQLGPGGLTIALASEHTEGGLSVIEYDVPAGFPGPPLHVHPSFDVAEGGGAMPGPEVMARLNAEHGVSVAEPPI